MQNQTTYTITQTFIAREDGMIASLNFDAWGTGCTSWESDMQTKNFWAIQ